jgi:hypothetical protein
MGNSLGLHKLVVHPDTPSSGKFEVTVGVNQAGYLLELNYRIVGDNSRLLLPKPHSYKPERSDGLWEHTCFEAFWKPTSDPQYFELNVAPSRAFAIYCFESYRTAMRNVDPSMPRIFYAPPNDGTALNVVFIQPFDGPSQLGLSAVIEETDGTKSYWALRHPPGKPDFHHPDCFALELAAPDLT